MVVRCQSVGYPFEQLEPNSMSPVEATNTLTALAFYTLGLGLPSAVQSFATAYVSPAHVSILYVAFGMANTLGSLIAAPLLALTFSLGLRLGGNWMGLPFWVSGLLYVAVGACVWSILRIKVKKSGAEEAVE